MAFELSDLADLHDNNIKAWWNDIVSSAQLMLEDQQKTLKDLEAGKKVNKKFDDDDIDMKFLNGEDDDDDDDGPDIADLLPAKAQPKNQVKEVKEEAKVVRASVKPEPKKEVPPAVKSS